MRFLSGFRHLNSGRCCVLGVPARQKICSALKGIRGITTIVLVIALVTGAWCVDAHAASANAPVPKSVVFRGGGTVKVTFLEKVKYKRTSVIVKDEDGNKYKTRIISKDSDSLTFYVKKCREGTDYTFKIKGIKVRGFKKYATVIDRFHSFAAEKPVVEEVEYDPGARQVEFEFGSEVEWDDPTVTITRGGKNYSLKIIDTDDDGIEVKVRKLKYGKTYKYKIKGIRVKGSENYVTVKGTFKALAGR